MAGIGFVLRKLYQQDNLTSLFRACAHSMFASSGPWLFTVLSLALISFYGASVTDADTLLLFRTVLIYNFSFSLVISGPVFMIATRYLADCLHAEDLSGVPGLLVGSLSLLLSISVAFACLLYFFLVDLPGLMAVMAIINFVLLSGVWLVGIFISALRRYGIITRAFMLGMAVSALAACGLARTYGVEGMLGGFSAGLAATLALLLTATLAEYAAPFARPFAFLSYFRRYREIALSGLVYNLAIWADKWIMWLAPEALRLPQGLRVYPNYDSAMFLAYLTTVPAMALFLFSAETQFFEKYAQLFRDIREKASFAKIAAAHRALLSGVFSSMRYLLLLQGGVVLICVLMAAEIIARLHGDYLQVGMLRYGIMGALFHVFTLFLLVLLSYFDSRTLSLFIQGVFLITNVGLTMLSIKLGFAYYGYGYFLSAFITFLIAAVFTVRYLLHLPYHSFVTSNPSAR